MYLAAVDFGTIHTDVLVQNLVSTLLYFVVGVVILVLGFAMVDALSGDEGLVVEKALVE